MNRRDFIRTAGGAAGATAAVSASAGTAAASSEGGGGGGTKPDFGGWLDDANGYDGSVADETGNGEITVEVGTGSQGYGFTPPAVHVDTGTTVKFEWTGEGGSHNVVSEDDGGPLDSGSAVGGSGVQYEHTFEESGIYNYKCVPHESLGMLGSVVVGEDYPTVEAGGGGEKEPHEMGVPFQAHYVGLATILMVLVSLIFTFFLLKYGESPHTKGGND